MTDEFVRRALIDGIFRELNLTEGEKRDIKESEYYCVKESMRKNWKVVGKDGNITTYQTPAGKFTVIENEDGTLKRLTRVD